MAVAGALVVGCAGYTQGSAAGEVIDPAAAAQTVVLRVHNINSSPMELRTIMNGHSDFIGSVSGSDSTSILLDPKLFPTGFLYIVAIPSDASGRALVGPLSASRGDQIKFTIQPALDMSNAIVIR
jgi:hypothetical protein